jgi:hypothetical protein
MPFLMLNTFSIGVVTPNVVHGILEPVPEIAGVASSLFGSTRMVAGAISTEVVAFWYNGTPMAMTGTMLLFTASAFGFWLLSLRFILRGRRQDLSTAQKILLPITSAQISRANPNTLLTTLGTEAISVLGDAREEGTAKKPVEAAVDLRQDRHPD